MFYEPVQSERFFNPGQRYSDIDWSDFNNIVAAWDRRIRGWYIDPIEAMLTRDLVGWRRSLFYYFTKRTKPGHFAFTVLSTSCLLIDALSQYQYGELKSTGATFKKFVDDYLPSYKGTLAVDVWHYDHSHNQNGKKLYKYSDVLWNSFRCGILHQAHAPLNCGVVPGKEPPKVETVVHATYGSSAVKQATAPGSDCPVVVIQPEHLFDELIDYFNDYIGKLVNPSIVHNPLRAAFRVKFSDSFGVDISGAKI